MINIAIIDDHNLFSSGLKILLESINENWKIHPFESYNAGKAFLGTMDLLFLDINLENENGLQICRKTAKDHPGLKIIALTMVDSPRIVREMLANGAQGYVLKNVSKEKLKFAISAVLSGQQYLDDKVKKSLLDNKGHAIRKAKISSLSRREKEVLTLIIAEFTTHEISDKLHISFNTVESHRKNIAFKLGAKNTAGIVRIALENNLL